MKRKIFMTLSINHDSFVEELVVELLECFDKIGCRSGFACCV